MKRSCIIFSLLGMALAFEVHAQRPYRLDAVDLKQAVIWGAESRQPEGHGLAFGGQDQSADDGRPHTREWVDGEWKSMHRELREKNPLQADHQRVVAFREELKNMRGR